MNIGLTHLHIKGWFQCSENTRLQCVSCQYKLPTIFIYNYTFYDIYCRGMRSQSHLQIQVSCVVLGTVWF